MAVAAMESMISSFPSSVPAQLESFIVYCGPPAAKHSKNHAPKPAEPLREFDESLGQLRAPGDFAECSVPRSDSIDEDFRVVCPACSGARARTDDKPRAAYHPSDSSGNVWANGYDTFADVPDLPPELSNMWNSGSDSASLEVADNLESTASAPPPYPKLDSPSIRCVPSASSITGQAETPQITLAANYERKLERTGSAAGWLESNESCSPAVCAGPTIAHAILEQPPRTSLEILPTLEPDRDLPETSCGAATPDFKDSNGNKHVRDAADARDTLLHAATHDRPHLLEQVKLHTELPLPGNDKEMHVVPGQAGGERTCREDTGCGISSLPKKRQRSTSSSASDSGVSQRRLQRKLSAELEVKTCCQGIQRSRAATEECVDPNTIDECFRSSRACCDQQRTVFNRVGIEVGGAGRDNSQRRFDVPTGKPRRYKPRSSALLRPVGRSTRVAQLRSSQEPSIRSTLRTRCTKGQCHHLTNGITMSAPQHDLVAPPADESEEQPTWAVDRIISSARKHGKVFYKVKWKPTWEPAESLQDSAAAAIAEFHYGHAR